MSARSLNKVQLIGNLTRDPEMRYTAGGTAVVTFGMATNKSWKGQDGNVEESAQFHNIVAWNKMAEICNQLLTKGMKVYVEGELNTRSWEGEDGVTRYKTEIRVNDMILLDSKGKAPAGGEGASAPTSKASAAPADKPNDDAPVNIPEDISSEDPTEDDLPF